MIEIVDSSVKRYLSSIGRRGGKKSKRKLPPETAREMVRIREARRAYSRFHSLCFWSYDPDYLITKQDISWVVEQLKKNGNRHAWQFALRLCR
jgi:hypothetical protein